ncbi:hypothetical protein NE647_11965, partial [Blautia coccoides]|nr:hypothetical protein [Blautia coccoides]
YHRRTLQSHIYRKSFTLPKIRKLCHSSYPLICAESEKAYQKNEEIKKNLHMHIKEANNQQTNL